MSRTLAGVRVIVTDGETRPGLYVVRSLARAGCRVTVLARREENGRVIAFSSRFAAERRLVPEGPYRAILPEMLERLAADHDVVVPVGTESIAVVAEQAEALKSRIRFHVPTPTALATAADKAASTRIARDSGVPTPETYHRLDPATIGDWARDSGVGLPLVVKFVDDARDGAWLPVDRYRIVRSVDDLVREYRRMHGIAPYPLVQEYIEGDGYGFFAITDASGVARATFEHKRLREYPISGGPSTLCESVADARLADLGARVLRGLMFTGVAMVEFKHDRHRGDFKFLEVNPRFWGSLPLAIQCGVDFPAYQVELSLGRIPRVAPYPVGRKMRFFLSDLRAVVAQWRAGQPVAGRYLRELADLSIRDGLFDGGDPWPIVTYLRSHVGR